MQIIIKSKTHYTEYISESIALILNKYLFSDPKIYKTIQKQNTFFVHLGTYSSDIIQISFLHPKNIQDNPNTEYILESIAWINKYLFSTPKMYKTIQVNLRYERSINKSIKYFDMMKAPCMSLGMIWMEWLMINNFH